MLSAAIAILVFIILPLSAAIKLPLLGQGILLIAGLWWASHVIKKQEGLAAFPAIILCAVMVISAIVGNLIYYFQYYDSRSGLLSFTDIFAWFFKP